MGGSMNKAYVVIKASFNCPEQEYPVFASNKATVCKDWLKDNGFTKSKNEHYRGYWEIDSGYGYFCYAKIEEVDARYE